MFGWILDVPVSLALLLISPWLASLVLVKGRGFGSLQQRIGGWRISLPTRERIWVHAASVGEVRATVGLIDSLARNRPGCEVVFSTMTTGARSLARELYPDVQVYLLPLDLSHFMHRMLARLRPDVLILVELEWWPNLLLACQARSVPVVVVNGRISPRNEGRLRWLGPLTGWMARCPELVCARTRRDADAFQKLGTPAEKIILAGDIKMDAVRPPDPHSIRRDHDRRLGHPGDLFRWIAGCTHPGEEEQVLEVHRRWLEECPGSQLWIGPRHVERSNEVLLLAKRSGFEAVLESQLDGATAQVVVIDTLGRLDGAYRISDAAFVGGSLARQGGHNLLEPVAAGCATCHGPHVDNFLEMQELLQQQGAVTLVDSGDQILPWLREQYSRVDLSESNRDRARQVLEHLGGASDRCVRGLGEVLI